MESFVQPLRRIICGLALTLLQAWGQSSFQATAQVYSENFESVNNCANNACPSGWNPAGFTPGKYLSFSCMKTSTGGLGKMLYPQAHSGDWVLAKDPNTMPRTLLTPEMTLASGTPFSLGFWVAKYNTTPASVLVEVDKPSTPSGTYQTVDNLALTQAPGKWQHYTHTLTAAADGFGRYRLTLMGAAGGQRVLLDDLEISPANFQDSRCQVPPMALPVEMAAFKATKHPNNAVFLEWSTLSEKNNDFFTLERSTDGLNFQAIDIIGGKGTTQKLSTYSYLDHLQLDLPEGVVYYRLRQTDHDGSFTYSKVIAVSQTQKGQEMAFAGTVRSARGIELTIENPEEKTAKLRVYDIKGRPLHSEQLFLRRGTNTIEIPNKGHGVRIIHLSDGYQSIAQKISPR